KCDLRGAGVAKAGRDAIPNRSAERNCVRRPCHSSWCWPLRSVDQRARQEEFASAAAQCDFARSEISGNLFGSAGALRQQRRSSGTCWTGFAGGESFAVARYCEVATHGLESFGTAGE